MVLTGCSDDSGSSDPNAPVTLTLAGWSLSTTPEFKTLADGFHAANPNITVELKEYDATNYDTQMIADRLAPAVCARANPWSVDCQVPAAGRRRGK
jgi:multiple sugar transport system substrate-binding protein